MRSSLARPSRLCAACSGRIRIPSHQSPSTPTSLPLRVLLSHAPRCPFSSSRVLCQPPAPPPPAANPAGRILSITSSTSPPQAQITALPDLSRLLAVVEQTRSRLLSTDGIPTRELTLVALGTCLGAARTLAPNIKRHLAELAPRKQHHHHHRHQQQQQQQHQQQQQQQNVLCRSRAHSQVPVESLRTAIENISRVAYDIITHPPVVITPELLHVYVETHAQLNTAIGVPEALALFASKPLPRAAGDRIAYTPRNPNRADAAVRDDIATKALGSAISAHDLGAAVEIAKVCYGSTAFKRQYLLRHAARPAAAVLATPPLAYGIASGLAPYLGAVADPTTTSCAAFLGIMAYVGCTAALGTVARVSNMDHMVRVTWLPGTSLLDKWLREPERAALDRIAFEWGFKDRDRYGEESGPEWEALRQYIYLRSMILDRVEFMASMNP